MNTNGMPILDVQNGFVGRYEAKYDPYNYSSPYYPYTKTFLTAGISDIVASGQEVLDERAAKAQAEAEAEAAEKLRKRLKRLPKPLRGKRLAKWSGSLPTVENVTIQILTVPGMIDPEKVDLGYAKYLGSVTVPNVDVLLFNFGNFVFWSLTLNSCVEPFLRFNAFFNLLFLFVHATI